MRNNAVQGRTIVLLICLSLSTVFCKAQDGGKQNLLAVLQSIEQTFNVRFSYAVVDIADVSLLYEAQPTLEASLDYLTKNIPFTFNKIDDRYITVVKNTSEFLCGRVLAADTGLPLENATIVSNLTSFGTLSNSDGTFFIPKALLNEELLIRFVGYQPWQVAVSDLNLNCESILIPAEVSTLQTVFIKNFLVKGLSKNMDGSFGINTSEFGLLPGQVENDILFVTQALPGIQSVNETISNINVRGGTHDENLILWNDIKSYQSGHFFGLISAFNPDITQEVKVYKNGTPIRYGDGISSVIAMKSRDELSEGFHGGAGLNLINGSAFAYLPVSDKAAIQVSGRSSFNALWESPVYQTYSEKVFQDTEISNTDPAESGLQIAAEEDFSFYDLSTRFLWDMNDKDKLRVNFLAMNNTLTFNETILETERSKNSELDLKSILGGLSWERAWNDTFSTRVLTYVTTYYLRALNRDLLTTQEVFQENDVLETGIKLDTNLELSNNFMASGGYQFVETGITNEQEVNLPRFVDFKKSVLRTHAAFAGLTFTSNDNHTRLNGGVRFNYFTKFDKLLIEPRIALHQKLVGGLSLEAQGEFKSQATTQRIDFDSDFLGVEKRRWVLADEENIPVVTSKQASLGLLYEVDGWLLNAEGFYKEVEGISSGNQGFQNQFQFVRSSGSYLANGAEFVVNKEEKNYSIWLSYAFLNNTYEFNSFQPTSFPHNLDVTHTATFAGSLIFDRLKVASGINYHSGKPYTIPLTEDAIITDGINETIAYSSPNAERLTDYYRLDLSAEYNWEISQNIDAKINLAVLNVLDTRNTLNIRYVITQDTNGESSINEVRTTSLGISPNFSLQLLF
ncbi:MAG: TonB-dependent receptor [Flavobacterium sp.]|nr:MAG: TonB-dependent receptor [Flavobacterium sp.]